MDERNIKWAGAIGGICGPMVELLKRARWARSSTQDFDLDAVANSIHQTPNHFEMSASQYANPANKGAFVNKLTLWCWPPWRWTPALTSTCSPARTAF